MYASEDSISFGRTLTSCFGLLIIFLCLSNIATGQDALKPAHTLVPCDIAGVTGEVRCGTYEVFENRTAKSGRKIPLKIVVLSATGTQRAPDPFVFIVGGPGGSSTGEAPSVAKMFA